MRRIIKFVALGVLTLLGAGVLLVAAGLALVWLYVWLDRRDHADLLITDVLIRDRRYDPAEKFSFTRACMYPPESGIPSEVLGQNYKELDHYLGNSHTDWNLVLINDNDKTFQRLWIEDPRVAFDGKWLCVPKLTLVVEETSEGLVAHARW